MAENIYNGETLTGDSKVKISDLLSLFNVRDMEPWKRGLILYSLLVTNGSRKSISKLATDLNDLEQLISSNEVYSSGKHWGFCVGKALPCALCKLNALKIRGEHYWSLIQMLRL